MQGLHRRFEVVAGAQAQVAWGDECAVLLDAGIARVYSFHMTLSYSRDPFCCFTTSQDLGTFFDCHRRAFARFGVPGAIIYDRTKTVVRRHVAPREGRPAAPGGGRVRRALRVRHRRAGRLPADREGPGGAAGRDRARPRSGPAQLRHAGGVGRRVQPVGAQPGPLEDGCSAVATTEGPASQAGARSRRGRRRPRRRPRHGRSSSAATRRTCSGGRRRPRRAGDPGGSRARQDPRITSRRPRRRRSRSSRPASRGRCLRRREAPDRPLERVRDTQTVASSKCFPMIIIPVGRPLTRPAGTEQAGWPVTSVTQVFAIISSARGRPPRGRHRAWRSVACRGNVGMTSTS